ncbi:acyl-CoA carboxylase subunit epsilon [Saccharomonospora glauca]|jgi:hypothetical protein|uniref:Acyl-CoA carboxylase epsilon subunit-like protein n=1 Tax=Saccharomonospora glauca K62 TaxID=928724 RepID=I1CY25_9PSEU|nr:acyl-CoA carboxylase subunit epsilon [Saccharomonospora glauca]EIE97599.1 hypothetical protein SacglDRAFT_00653 [Saccharomonospora glauca K62]
MADEGTPLLHVVKGRPDDAELAALTVVVAGLASAGAAGGEASRPSSRWADPASRLRLPARPGPTAWRASAYPA